jgi:hypothetical protein
MSGTLSLELQILRDALKAVAAGEQVIEILVGVEVWWRLHAERPRHGYLFEASSDEPHLGHLAGTPVRPDISTTHWTVITTPERSRTPARGGLH